MLNRKAKQKEVKHENLQTNIFTQKANLNK